MVVGFLRCFVYLDFFHFLNSLWRGVLCGSIFHKAFLKVGPVTCNGFLCYCNVNNNATHKYNYCWMYATTLISVQVIAI